MARSPRGIFPNGSLQGYLDTRRANLARTSSFWIHGGDILPLRGVISVRGLLENTWRSFIAMVRHCRMHCAPFDSRLARRCSARRQQGTRRWRRGCWGAAASDNDGAVRWESRAAGWRRRCPQEIAGLIDRVVTIRQGLRFQAVSMSSARKGQGAIQRERALRFEWMGWLRAFIAGVVLALGLARVSPSGKARASQARMRGFESRHPLQKNLKPVFNLELRPTGGGSFGDRLF